MARPARAEYRGLAGHTDGMNDLIKLMIPGAGHGQAILAKKAKELGLYVVVVSPPGEYPGFAYADKTYHEDARDKEAVLRIARAEAVAGIVADQTDIPVETIGYVVEQLGLRGNDYATSRLFHPEEPHARTVPRPRRPVHRAWHRDDAGRGGRRGGANWLSGHVQADRQSSQQGRVQGQ